MTAQQLLRVALARWWVMALVFAATVGATTVVSLLLPRMYSATTRVVIEPRSSELLSQNAPGLSPSVTQTLMATQLDVFTSERVAQRVIVDLGIEKSETARRQWMEATDGQGTMSQYFSAVLLKNLEVRPSRDSAVFTVNFTARDPVFAAEVANAFARAYINLNLEMRTAPAQRSAAWFDDQIKKLRENVEAAQASLSRYQQEKGIVASDERLDSENARLAELSQQLTLAQSSTFDARARAAQGGPLERSLPDVAGAPVVRELRTDIARAQARLDEASENFGPAHPTHLRLKAELDSLRERLANELDTTTGNLETASVASQQREASLSAAVTAQKARVLQSKQHRDEMAALMREADNAQRIYDAALQRMSQSRLEAASTQSNAFILSAAQPPTEPSSPKTQVYIALSVGIGLMLGLAAAAIVEVTDRRVRCEADIEGGLKVQCMGVLPRQTRWPRLSSRRRDKATPVSPALGSEVI
jgi:chain length determinant protein EpsF